MFRLPWQLSGKVFSCNARDTGLIRGSGRSPGGGQFSRIPWTEEPGRLQSMGLQRTRHNWSDLAHTNIQMFTVKFIHIFYVLELFYNIQIYIFNTRKWQHHLLWLCDQIYDTHCLCRGRNTETAMAPHSSTLAWKIPWMEEPGRLQSMGSLRVRYD